ncbi:carbohydrate sulfotransferase 15-like [Amphiura filiformis]|uniref:carbohydrate sulfotransferase 15-like n=1 Tax=Amphiura filiformis TaxID=82378 RepID=UPI003B20D143
MVHLRTIFATLMLIVLVTALAFYNTSAINQIGTQLLTRLEKDETNREQSSIRTLLMKNVGESVINKAGNHQRQRQNNLSRLNQNASRDIKDIQKRQQNGFAQLSQEAFHDKCPQRRNITLEDIEMKQLPDNLYKLAPEVFDQFPKTFLEGYSNPCWKQGGDQIRCLPKLFLAGVAKCGTTDLYLKVASHPLIIHAKEKEPSWWTRNRYDRKQGEHKPVGSFFGYLHEFDKLANKMKSHQDADTEVQKLITVDGSPSTFWDNVFWRKYVSPECTKGPTYVIADVIRAILPKTKIIAIFRNPTDRLYSDYMFTGGRARTPQTFHEHVLKSTASFDSCLESGGNLRSCIYKNFNGQHGHVGHDHLVMLMKGLYSVHAREWLYAFPREQLMFIRFEDWYSKCKQILPEIYSFLELDSLMSTQIDKICAKKNPTRKKNSKGPMLNATRTILNKFYQVSRQELAQITGDMNFLWDEWT